MLKKGVYMEKMKRLNRENLLNKELGFLLWQLEEIENFYPCYKSMLKKED